MTVYKVLDAETITQSLVPQGLFSFLLIIHVNMFIYASPRDLMGNTIDKVKPVSQT